MEKKILISREEISNKIILLARHIAQEYKNKKVVLVSILDGAFIFTADLCRELYSAGLTDVEVTFIGVSSYGSGTKSGNLRITKDLTIDIVGKNVIVIEDIVDTGFTLDYVLAKLREKSPASLKTCVLLSKGARRKIEIVVDYVGFEIEGDTWVEGYGLDTKYTGRGNPDIIEVHA